jgi:VanZ family protein
MNRMITIACLVIAALVNVAGYAWNLYDRWVWFDEILHAFTLFTLTLALALVLAGVVLTGVRQHAGLYVLVVLLIGLGIGALWEVAEWGYDHLRVPDVIQGKTDTIIDLIMDGLGALLAGVFSLALLRRSEPPVQRQADRAV